MASILYSAFKWLGIRISIFSARLTFGEVSSPSGIILNGQNWNWMLFIHFTMSEWPQILFGSDTLRVGINLSRLTLQIVSEPSKQFFICWNQNRMPFIHLHCPSGPKYYFDWIYSESASIWSDWHFTLCPNHSKQFFNG